MNSNSIFREEILLEENLYILCVCETFLTEKNKQDVNGYKYYPHNRSKIHPDARRWSGGIGINITRITEAKYIQMHGEGLGYWYKYYPHNRSKIHPDARRGSGVGINITLITDAKYIQMHGEGLGVLVYLCIIVFYLILMFQFLMTLKNLCCG